MQHVPYSEEFERAVLVAILQDPQVLPRVSSILAPDDFYKNNHQEIYKSILDLGMDNLDSLTVEDKLSERSKEYFKQLVEDSDRILPSLSNTMFYAESIKGKARLRAGIDLGQKITATCFSPSADVDSVLSDLEQMFAEFIEKRVLNDVRETTAESFKSFISSLGKRIDDPDVIRTGFWELDMLLQKVEGLNILAARPGMGKTAFAINIARKVAEHRPVIFFSLEQSKEQVFERMLAAESQIPLEEIRTGAFLAEPMSKASISAAETSLLKVAERLHIDDTPDVGAAYISSVSRQKRYEWGDIGLIVVDYLHIMRLDSGDLVNTLGQATKDLRALGKELGCPVILLSQLSRQPEKSDGKKVSRRPQLSDLRSSGEIEQTADVVMFLYRDSYYEQPGLAPEEDVIEVIVQKQRNGPPGVIKLKWLPKYMRFENG